MTVGRKGADQLRRDFERLMIEHVDLKGVRQLGYVNALDISQRILKRFEHGEFDVATLFFSKFENVITQKPKSTQLIPVELPPSESSMSSSLMRRKFCSTFCREILRPRFIARCWKTMPASTHPR